MYTIEVDFEVFKELTYRRQSEADDCNAVIRRLLNLPPNSTLKPDAGGMPWIAGNVSFPHGTEFRATRKGKTYSARVNDALLLVNGEAASSLSHAAELASGMGENGWLFWRCKRPGDADFKLVDELRKK